MDETHWLPIESDTGVLFALSGVCALFFWLERATKWSLFRYLPPLIFIYLVPVILSNIGVMPTESPVYDAMKRLLLPMLLVLLLIKVDVGQAIKVLGRGVGVMLFGTLGVVIGAPIGLLLMSNWLGPDAWKAFGTLSGSWIGGTANMAAVSEAIDAQGTEIGLAILGDSTIYLLWLPILLGAKRFATKFSSFTGVETSLSARMEEVSLEPEKEKTAPEMQHYLYLLCVAFLATWLAEGIANCLPVVEPYLNSSTWKILLITTIGIALSFTSLRDLPGSHELGMALLYLFVARMGASAKLDGVATQAIPFLAGALIMIFIHGLFCLLGAKLFRVDIHCAAIASAANVGGAASSVIVASHHKESLVPSAILLSLIGYSIGNYAGYVTALLCRLVS